MSREKKRPTVYIWILIIWLIPEILGGIPLLIHALNFYDKQNYVAMIILILNFIFISYFWLNGTKDIVYVYYYHRYRPEWVQKELAIINNATYNEQINNDQPRVALIYTTYNDFIPSCLLKCMNQTYSNFQTYILDDSTSPRYINQVDQFAREHHATVVRRKNKQGFKAGNLNHFLCNNDDWDYFVILDSDEIIPNDFIEKSLPFFYEYQSLGILQCNHISTRNENKFMTTFFGGVDAHWPTYQSVKERYGFLSLLGHGAMISKRCFRDVQKFPEVVAEDISFTLEGTFKGWETRFAMTIDCEEQFPIDYLAFKKRQFKWTNGNIEFIKTFSKRIFTSHELTWMEKLDITLFVYSLPLTSIFSIFLVMNIAVMPALDINPKYAVWLLIPTVVFLFSPAVNDMIMNVKNKHTLSAQIIYSFNSILLYGSMYCVTIYSAFRYLLGNDAKFIVTPKSGNQYTWSESLIGNLPELMFATVLAVMSFIFGHSIAPVILIIIPSYSSIYLTHLSNKEVYDI